MRPSISEKAIDKTIGYCSKTIDYIEKAVLVHETLLCINAETREKCEGTEARVDEIRSSLRDTDWTSIFVDLTANEMTNKFTILIMDLMRRFIPNQMIRRDDRDPPWITPKLRRPLNLNIEFITNMSRGVVSLTNVKQVRNETSAMITDSKDDYFAELSRKLSNPNNGPKTYWTTLNRITNKKKAINIPPLLENGLFVTNFQTKADIFNKLFVQQCSFNQNNSALPFFPDATQFWKTLRSIQVKF